MNKYDVIIYWSDEDEAFGAEVPELPGCVRLWKRRAIRPRQLKKI
jgi:hypothetical protein